VLSRPSQRRVEVFCRDAVFTLDGDWHGPVSTESGGSDGHGRVTTVEGSNLTEAVAELDGLGVNPDAAFLDAVRHRRPAYPDFAVALEAHRLADAAYRSAAQGGVPVVLS
jgi:predicted dehydrogenase